MAIVDFAFEEPLFIVWALVFFILYLYYQHETNVSTLWRKYAKKEELEELLNAYNLRIVPPVILMVAWLLIFIMVFIA